MSAAGGVSVSFVFLHLLPELAEGQRAVEEATDRATPGLEQHAYLMALAGLGLFYGIELWVQRSKETRKPSRTDAVFTFSMASYAVYNAIIGYALHQRAEEGVAVVATYTLAMGLHFFVNDFALREHHREAYAKIGRWVLVGAICAGALAAQIVEVSEAALALVLAFIAGSIILNVLKEELPTQSESSFTAFALGAGGYAALLLFL